MIFGNHTSFKLVANNSRSAYRLDALKHLFETEDLRATEAEPAG